MKKKFISLLLALVMILGTAMPALAISEEANGTNSVILHKLLMTKEDLGKWDHNKLIEKEGETAPLYDASKALDLKAVQGKLGLGAVPTEIAGVYFAWMYAEGENVGKYVTVNGDTVGATDDLNDEHILGGKTEATGKTFDTSKLPAGKYKIVEIREKSDYKGQNGEILADSKAVPVEITLPVRNNSGVVTTAHVYPKNTQDKPKIDKDFADGFGGSKGANADKDRLEETNKIPATPVKVGDFVPYHVQTKIPAKSHLKKAVWSDTMTKGLTMIKDQDHPFVITLDKQALAAEDYVLVIREDGFDLRLTQSGLEKINNKEQELTIDIKYYAQVNTSAIIDQPDKNDVKFYYGNNPGKDFESEPTKPVNEKIKVTKTWGDGVAKSDIIFDLFVNENGTWTFVASKTLKNGETSVEFDKLDNGKQYKVIERESGYDVTYNKPATDGAVTVKNDKNPNNPPPLNPEEPSVVTGGKKFVKTDNDNTELRLAGAQFIIKNDNEGPDKGKYLKAIADVSGLKTAFEQKQKAYEAKVAEYNTEAAKESPDQGKLETLKGEVATAKTERDTAYQAYINQSYEWTTEKNQALVFTTNEKGQFEVKGLAYGNYTAVEIKAPEGYSLPTNAEFAFTVSEGSYMDGDIPYDIAEEGAGQALNIKNKKTNIPQTGGIGTIIFTVAGLAIMGTAVMSLRKKNVERA